jgi:hypothetical protein
MQARFPGTCRDCGNKFPAGTDIDWQKGQGASCCNDSHQSAAQRKTPIVFEGAQQMEWVKGKITQEVVGYQGDSLIYEQKEYNGYSWMCLGCRLVWERRHQATNCESRGHVDSFEQSYGGTQWDGRGFTPHGLVAGKYLPNTGTTYVRTAIRRERNPREERELSKARHLKNNEPAPQVTGYDPKLEADKPWSQVVKEREIRECRVCTSMIANHLAFGRQPNPSDSTLCECCEEKPAPQADPQDMTSEEMWESMASVNQPTITTSWN